MCTLNSVLTAIFSIQHALSRSIKIQNPSFENEVSIDANTFAYGVNIIPYWQPHDESGVTQTYSFGLTNPSRSTLFTSDNAPDGSIIAHLIQNNDKKIGKGEMSISQELKEVLVADSSYTLRVLVGNPYSNTFSAYRQYFNFGPWEDRNGSFVNGEGFPGYIIDLLAGNNIIAQDSNTNIGDGQWATISIDAGPFASDDPNIGKILSIRLVNMNKVEGKSVMFDNVQLDVTTSSPTQFPTKQPTLTLSGQPSTNPTLAPTQNPTFVPSLTPIIIPSNSPSSQPTKARTYALTFIPTSNPTEAASAIVTPSAYLSTDFDGFNQDESGESDANTVNIVMITCSALFIALSLFICIRCYVIFRRKVQGMKANEANIQHSLEMPPTNPSQADMIPATHQTKDIQIHIDNESDDEAHASSDDTLKLKQWLKDIECGEYFDAFMRNGFGRQMCALSELNDDDLQQIGVILMGHRKLILREIKILCESTTSNGDSNIVPMTPMTPSSDDDAKLPAPGKHGAFEMSMTYASMEAEGMFDIQKRESQMCEGNETGGKNTPGGSTLMNIPIESST